VPTRLLSLHEVSEVTMDSKFNQILSVVPVMSLITELASFPNRYTMARKYDQQP